MDHINLAMEINGGQLEENDDFGIINSDIYTKDGSTDLHGRPAIRANTGRWRAAKYIIGNEGLNCLGFYGATTNLVVYFTKILHQGNATAANNVSNWTGTSSLFPIIGAFFGDAYWGRYRTSIVFSFIYLLGMGLLTLSASLPALKPAPCPANMDPIISNCKKASSVQTSVFYLALYVMSLGSTGYQPCLTALGADQFDEEDEEEKKQQSSFFNWFYFSVNVGALLASTLLVYVEQDISWGLGFGICMGVAVAGVLILMWGSPTYRRKKSGGNPMRRVLQVIVASARKWKVKVPNDGANHHINTNHIINTASSNYNNRNRLHEVLEKESAIKGSRKMAHTKAFRFLDKAATETEGEREMRTTGKVISSWRLCTVTQVEEVKFVLRVFPVWVTSILFSTVYVQMSTLFVEQGSLMNTRVVGGLAIPPAAVSTFDTMSVILWVPIYDRIIVRLASKWTGRPRGLTSLQRIGVGLMVSILSMVAAAIVEVKRLRLAREEGVVATGQPVMGMSVFWQVPQYAVVGAAEVFTYIGQMELFYDEAPDALRSLSGALVGLASALGNYLSTLLVTIVNRFTSTGHDAWIPQDNLNLGHLDRFFSLLAVISAVNLFVFIWFARRYQYTSHVV